MSMQTFGELILAHNKSPEELEKAKKAHAEAVKNAPTDAEVLTDFLSKCTNETGEPILQKGEHADLVDGHVRIHKSS